MSTVVEFLKRMEASLEGAGALWFIDRDDYREMCRIAQCYSTQVWDEWDEELKKRVTYTVLSEGRKLIEMARAQLVHDFTIEIRS